MKILRILFLLGLIIIFSCDKSKDFWVATKLENTIQSYRKFIDDFPKSAFTDSAHYCLKRLEQFEEASNENTIEAYEAFIKSYSSRRNSLVDSAKSIIESIHFDEAKTLNTFNGYFSFLDLYPESIFTDSVNAQTNTLKLLRHPDIQTGSTAKIIINYKVPGANNNRIIMDIQKRVNQALIASGFSIVEPTDNSDITLKIGISGKALSKKYGRKKLYSGAKIEGSIALLAQKGIMATYPIKRTDTPPDFMLLRPGEYEKPEDAPFRSLLNKWNYSFELQLFEIIYKYMGYPSFIGLLEQSSYDFLGGTVSNLSQTYFHHINYFSRLSTNEKNEVVQSLIFILESKKDCNWKVVVFLLGELGDKRAMKSIMENNVSVWAHVTDHKKMAMEKIINKKFKTFDDLRLWWSKQSNN